ncbi:uncharacterized protein LOC143857077 [Tasmannia lanceolata]|uniref:uncharacterized protein LOC143857077 n=1 Tax=Tasmannia lanceolata TaxID=3420 RepID=UPI004063E17C
MWKRKYISFGGRITLVKAALANMPVYYMSLFKIPAKVALRIEKLQRVFIWDGGGIYKRSKHLLDWNKVTRLKKHGGLGIGKIRLRNKALLGKWLWRYGEEQDNLWHKVIGAKYGSEWGGWNARRVAVGKGSRDQWVGPRRLEEAFPSLFRQATNGEARISDYLVRANDGGRGFWDIRLRRNLKDAKINNLAEMLDILNKSYCSQFINDVRIVRDGMGLSKEYQKPVAELEWNPARQNRTSVVETVPLRSYLEYLEGKESQNFLGCIFGAE